MKFFVLDSKQGAKKVNTDRCHPIWYKMVSLLSIRLFVYACHKSNIWRLI